MLNHSSSFLQWIALTLGILFAAPTLAGVVRRDATVPAAVRTQTCVSLRAPDCDAAKDIDALAGSLARGREAA